MKTCKTCTHWVKPPADDLDGIPKCHELRFWIFLDNKAITTPSDFGCVKHSDITGDTHTQLAPVAVI